MQAVLVWLLVSACAGGAWAVGYGMGYRRVATDAIKNDIPRAEHRFNGQ